MNERRWLALLGGLFAFFGFGYSLLMPMWEGPDEHAHYLLALNLARIDVFSSLERNYEAYQPQPYYRFASQVLKPLYEEDPDQVAYYHPRPYFRNVRRPIRIYDWNDENYRFLLGPQLLRWINLAAGSLALVCMYLGFRRFVPDQPRVRIAALGLAALTPQYLHTVSYVSNDALGILAGASLFWMLARIATGPVHPIFMALMAGAAVVLPPTTKMTVLPMSLAVLAGLGWRGAGWLRERRAWLLLGALLPGLAAAGWLIWRVPGSLKLLIDEFVYRALSYHPEAFTLNYLQYVTTQVVWSYWGKVGWLAVGLPGAAVLLLTGLALVGSGADLRALLKRGDGEGEAIFPASAWRLLWIAVGLAILVVGRNGLTTVNDQGRFLFPALGALVLPAVAGWFRILPERWRSRLPQIIIGLMVGMNLLLWLTGIIPVYYQPFLG